MSFHTTKTWVKLILLYLKTIWQFLPRSGFKHKRNILLWNVLQYFYVSAQLHKSSRPNVILLIPCPLLSWTRRDNLANRWTSCTPCWFFVWITRKLEFFGLQFKILSWNSPTLIKQCEKLSQIYIFFHRHHNLLSQSACFFFIQMRICVCLEWHRVY